MVNFQCMVLVIKWKYLENETQHCSTLSFFCTVSPVPGPVAEITYQIISDTEILVSWREPEMMNGLVLHYHINVTLYSTGQTVYTNVVPGGGDLSDSVTGLGKTHGGKICPLSSSL